MYTCYISSWIDNIAIPSITCSLSGLTITINNAFSNIVGSVTVAAWTLYGIVIN